MTTSTKKSDLESGMSDLLHEASVRVIELKDESVRTLSKKLDAMGRAMKDHPLLAICLGLGAGYLIGRITHRG